MSMTDNTNLIPVIGECIICQERARLFPLPPEWNEDDSGPWCRACIDSGPPPTDEELANDPSMLVLGAIIDLLKRSDD